MFGTKAKVLAQEALEMAREASARQDKHEGVCTERWTEARQTMKEVRDGQRKMLWWLIGTLVAMVGSTVAGLVFLLMHALISKGVL